MAAKIYALLVGINDYTPEVGKLYGCLNDVDHFRDYLTSTFGKQQLQLEVLKDSDATRGNIIKLFRSHLGKAGAEDVALFQYCGHGARWAAARGFKEFYPDGKDEGLVLYDSRRPGSAAPYDLADKELAILLTEVAKKDPHITVILDCCHSGSGTRTADDFRHLKRRMTHEVFDERPLDSYLDGHYAGLQKKKQPLFIPSSKHILLAACERVQQAYETQNRSGVFTDTLLHVLDKSGSDISYADLFVRCRAAVRQYADNQTPQFETSEQFNAYAGFLGRKVTHAARRFSVYFEDDSWKIDCGALHGLPTEADKVVQFALYPEDKQARSAGKATALQIGAQKSELDLDFKGDPKIRYRAEITSLPAAPLPIYLHGEKEGTSVLRKAVDAAAGVDLTDVEAGTRYALSAEGGQYLLKQRELDLLIQGVQGAAGKAKAGYAVEAASTAITIARHVAQWERTLALQNHGTRMDTSRVDLVFTETLAGGKTHRYPGNDITLDYVKSGDDWQNIRGKIQARNRTDQTVHFALLYFSSAYGIHILRNDPVLPGDDYVTLWGDNPDDYLYVDEGATESIENFKLFVSTERIDDFLLTQDDLEIGKIIGTTRGVGSHKPRQKIVHKNEWFTHHLRVKVVRQLDQVGSKDTSFANRKITIKGHPSVKAKVSLSAAKSATRGAGEGAGIYSYLEQQGMSLLNFAGSRGANESVLELTGIENAGALAKQPLQIELDVPLSEDEAILPLAFDGQHILLGGEVYKDDAGKTQLSIDYLPEVADTRRSVGKALKLYFFKTYLKRSVNQLRWVEFKQDGSIVQHSRELANKIAAAKNVLLLMHGIIGDSANIAKSLPQIKDSSGKSIAQKFDLVLTYDYENLNTPIETTAATLKKQLETHGIGDNDDKRLTLLVHSMGGLVSRWFVEQEGGNRMVDHLVLCGTPNAGSPFGKIDKARKLIGTLTTLAITYVPALTPFSGTILLLLNRSKKITQCLEQMDAGSEFMQRLNSETNPGIPYTILAGDVQSYQEPSDEFFPKLLAKTAKGQALGVLFGSDAHDIAVSVESILGVTGSRQPQPKKRNISCHHLNYFASEAGMQALGEVEW